MVFAVSKTHDTGSNLPNPQIPYDAGLGKNLQHRNYERHWTPVHLDFVVDEIEPAVRKAVSAGAQLEQPIATYKWAKLALMVAPLGHGFCFVQFLGQGYDEFAE